jgi:arylsulfatase A-like enzyme
MYFSSKDQELRKLSLEPTIYAPYSLEHQSVVDTYRNEYDEAIAFADFELGQFLNSLQRFDWWKDTLLIITSDHGESFERGYFGHGEELYESSTHIPLIIRWPGQEKGGRISGYVQTADIAPTILEALGIPIPLWMDGESLSPTRNRMSSYTVAVNSKFPLGKTIYFLPTKLAIWRQPYKAIFNCDTNQVVLYDLSTDPDERNNLSELRSTVLNELKHSIRASLDTGSATGLISCLEKVS